MAPVTSAFSLSSLWHVYYTYQAYLYITLFLLIGGYIFHKKWGKVLLQSAPPSTLSRVLAEYDIVPMTAIIAVIAGLIIPPLVNNAEQARKTRTAMQMSKIAKTLTLYKTDNGRYPTTRQGLEALVCRPAEMPLPGTWKQYLDKVTCDAWKNSFVYICPGGRQRSGDGKFYDLISHGPDGIESDDDIIFTGFPDIFVAVAENDTYAVSAFLNDTPDLIATKVMTGDTPLHYAARNGSLAAAKVLLERGAEREARNYEKFTPLGIAEKEKNKDMADLLRRYGGKK